MPRTTSKQRVVFRVAVDSQTAKRFHELCEDTGIPQITVTSKLLHWFNQQDSQVQARILGVFGEQDRDEVARLLLDRIAKGENDMRSGK